MKEKYTISSVEEVCCPKDRLCKDRVSSKNGRSRACHSAVWYMVQDGVIWCGAVWYDRIRSHLNILVKRHIMLQVHLSVKLFPNFEYIY